MRNIFLNLLLWLTKNIFGDKENIGEKNFW
jgi:hypothetical protein